jgi:choline dehydrogenase-like flavoprotein
MPRFDLDDDSVVIIVGSGAGGGTMAHELTRRGLKVVLLGQACANRPQASRRILVRRSCN